MRLPLITRNAARSTLLYVSFLVVVDVIWEGRVLHAVEEVLETGGITKV